MDHRNRRDHSLRVPNFTPKIGGSRPPQRKREVKRWSLPEPRPEWEIIYGNHAVAAALEESRRKIHMIVFQESGTMHSNESLWNKAESDKIPAYRVPREALDALTDRASHQGVLAFVNPLPLVTVKTILERMKTRQRAFIVVLDRIQDPQNLGAILRTCEAFGVDYVIVTADRSAPLQRATAKAAVGSLERVPLCKIVNLRSFLNELKANDFWIVTLETDASQSVFSFRPPLKCALVIGSEGEGIRRLVVKESDYSVAIPMCGKVNSLNASVAAGLAICLLIQAQSRIE